MANSNDRYPDNVPGAYYVDQECIYCHICSEHAPDFFQASEDGDHNMVFRQPTTEAERQECEAALDGCPVEAIGNDGENS